MSDYIVDSAELTAIANAIRTQGRITGNLIFPSGFVSAINDLAVPTGDNYAVVTTNDDGGLIDGILAGKYLSNVAASNAGFGIPFSWKTIKSGTFRNCSDNITIRFKGTPDSISPTAFVNCTGTITIKVPWSEGAIPGAPWGATGATIQYNFSLNN